MKRRKMPSRQSKRVFSKTAKYVNKKNTRAAPMRGGIRL
jgi:hypothetical protein